MTPVLIVLIVFSFVAFIVKMGLDHEREKRGLESAGAQNSLTTSELRRMIQDAVEDANQDLTKRLDTIERRLEAGRPARQLEEGRTTAERELTEPERLPESRRSHEQPE